MSSSDSKTLWDQTITALDSGDFTLLDELLRSKNASLIELLKDNGEPADEMNEAFAFACMVGRTEDAETLLAMGVEPYAGMKTWLAGPHWAASAGHLEMIRMLLRHKIPLEVKNLYGGTVLGQSLWSAINEPKPEHAEIIEALIDAGATIEPGTIEWWEYQEMPSDGVRKRIADALCNAAKDQ